MRNLENHSIFEPLSAAEKELRQAVLKAEECQLGDGKRPEKFNVDRQIRPEFIHYLLMGNIEKCKDGIIGSPICARHFELTGAWIGGSSDAPQKLDMETSNLNVNVIFTNCTFSDDISFIDAKTRCISFMNVKFNGNVNFDRANIDGDLFFRGDVICKKKLNLYNVRVRAHLYISECTVEELELASAIVEQVFMFHDFKPGCKKIDLSNARFSRIEFDCKSWGLEYFEKSRSDGQVKTYEASPLVGKVELDGLIWKRFQGEMPSKDIEFWLAWLGLQIEKDRGKDFKPQPYEQLASVFREAGREADARTILIQKRVGQRNARQKFPGSYGVEADRFFIENCKKVHLALISLVSVLIMITIYFFYAQSKYVFLGVSAMYLILFSVLVIFKKNEFIKSIKFGAAITFDWLVYHLVRYGYKAGWAVVWLMVANVIGTGVYSIAGMNSVMTPSNPLIYYHWDILGLSDLDECRKDWIGTTEDKDHECFKKMPQEYSPFNPLVYSFDVGIPLVEFAQETDWNPRAIKYPSGERDLLGVFVRAFQYCQISLGWILSLLFVSAISGIIRKE